MTPIGLVEVLWQNIGTFIVYMNYGWLTNFFSCGRVRKSFVYGPCPSSKILLPPASPKSSPLPKCLCGTKVTCGIANLRYIVILKGYITHYAGLLFPLMHTLSNSSSTSASDSETMVPSKKVWVNLHLNLLKLGIHQSKV